MRKIPCLFLWITLVFSGVVDSAKGTEEKVYDVLENYCFDCHDEAEKKGNLDLEKFLKEGGFDEALIFENLLTGKMPPVGKKQPDEEERRVVLDWLAEKAKSEGPNSFRRLSRHELVHSVNDLLGTNLDLAANIPEDRGTSDFDSDRRIQLSREMLGSYFEVTGKMLEHAFPGNGFSAERTWVTNKVRDSHQMYRSYHRPYRGGTLFSWTRSNNGISYSFFYDGFDPPEEGWYELTFEAAKVADFEDEMSLQVHTGKYYYADDRPQPQRLLGVISLGNRELERRTIRAFLRPGESISVHCFSRHNYREGNPQRGIYIKQLEVLGPVLDDWPPASYRRFFTGLPLKVDPREQGGRQGYQTNLQKIGGSVQVSSFQKGMEKEKLQDGSNLTFWHTRFSPSVAKAPHYVIFENPKGAEIEGLAFATWQGGNGNGLVKAYEIYFSEDGKLWGDKVMTGDLDVTFANVQPIVFPAKTTSRFIKFLVTDAVSLDGKSIASIGRLDVVTPFVEEVKRSAISVEGGSPGMLKEVLRKFAGVTFSTNAEEEELEPYFEVALQELERNGDFAGAVKVGLKAILGSSRFLMVPGEHANDSFTRAAMLARALWLSVPDAELLKLSSNNELHGVTLRRQIHRMLADERSARMIRSLSDQWLNLRGLNKVTPSLKLYPLYDDLLDHYLPRETRAYLAYLIDGNLPAGRLVDSDFSILNQRLARHYGVEGVIGQGLRKVTFPEGSPRGGLLTMGSVLKVTTDGFETSPILRGAWISKNIVGTPLSPPPESVPALEPEHGEAKTLKEQIDQHKSNKTCYACHKSIDPYGFSLENFDATGGWRGNYQIKQAHRSTFTYRPQGYFKVGAWVDASGEIDGREFQDIHGLKKVLLADERKIAYHFAKTFFEYTNGDKATLAQRLHLWDFLGKDPANRRMRDLITEVLVLSLNGAKK